ncbi:hypothetical protein NPIL_322511 [Nephila pilipes]|uniref:Uncharacterized protein n=1 Tax=Nephila pilipes TaxID=299642 RepID=A0A8X6MYS4_NEPPI|nr:hypothetical protein NPIL_322511 [Nephila pilipes]
MSRSTLTSYANSMMTEKIFCIDSAYNDGPLIGRPVKRWHPSRALYSSEEENSRSVEPAPVLSPKRTLWYQNQNLGLFEV